MTSFFSRFYELYFFDKCVTERYLSYSKQINNGEQVFHHFAWSSGKAFASILVS